MVIIDEIIDVLYWTLLQHLSMFPFLILFHLSDKTVENVSSNSL